jgi:hypothetical protein
MMDWRPDINSAAQHTTANKTLPSQAGESTVEEKGGSRKQSCMQSATPKHVKRRPKKGRVSLKETIEVTTIIRGDFQGIDRVERKLRRGTTAEHKATLQENGDQLRHSPHTWVSTQLLMRAESDQTEGRLPPPPQHTEVKQPSGEPPHSWRNVPTTDWRPDINSAVQHTTANKTLPS